MSFVTEPALDNSDLAPLPVRRFTVDQYRRMGQAGVLTEDDRVELLEGWIVSKMIHNPAHDGTVSVTNGLISRQLPASWIIRIQSAITTPDSEPEPDLAIARGPERRYMQRHPEPPDIALLVEVAESSLERDRFKCRLYARAGILTYWIINLVDRQIEVYTEPTGAEPAPAYRQRRDFLLDEQLPLVFEGQEVVRIPVRELLP